MEHRQALKILGKQDAVLPKAIVLRCRKPYFSDRAMSGESGICAQFCGYLAGRDGASLRTPGAIRCVELIK